MKDWVRLTPELAWIVRTHPWVFIIIAVNWDAGLSFEETLDCDRSVGFNCSIVLVVDDWCTIGRVGDWEGVGFRLRDWEFRLGSG